MPLMHDTVYTIRNDLTHTVLDFTGNSDRNAFVMGWGWHGADNQKWRLIHVLENKWKLQNVADPARFLCPQLEDAQRDNHYRLAGGIVSCDFIIEQVGATERYRILFNDDLAVTLVTGQGVHNIRNRDRVLDLYADGPPIVLERVEERNRAQIWSFLAADLPVTSALENGRAYKIVNSQTGTVLDIANTNGRPVLGLVSKGENEHKWTVTREAQDSYKFKSFSVANHFLAADIAKDDRPGNGTTLIGGPEAQAVLLTVHKVPDTRLYKIFFNPLALTKDVSGLALNLAVVDGAVDSLDGAVVSLQAAEAQKWFFV